MDQIKDGSHSYQHQKGRKKMNKIIIEPETENMVDIELELSDEQCSALIDYACDTITEDELMSYAIRDILEKRAIELKEESYRELKPLADIVLAVMENAAELGCPPAEEVDMWYRYLEPDEQINIIQEAKYIMEQYENDEF